MEFRVVRMLLGGLESLGLHVIIFLVQFAIGPPGRVWTGRAVKCGADPFKSAEVAGHA